jgi:hypothetical protein
MKEILDMHEQLVSSLGEKEIERLIESDDGYDDHACSELGAPDEIEIAIQEWIHKLIACGYYDEDANKAVFDGLADLVENNQLSDTPEVDDPLHIKQGWVQRFNDKIHAKLLSMGIDLSAPEALLDGNPVPTENWTSLD